MGSEPGITHVGCWAHARRRFDEAHAWRKVSLPTYAFDRERYWIAGQADTASETTTGAALAGPVS